MLLLHAVWLFMKWQDREETGSSERKYYQMGRKIKKKKENSLQQEITGVIICFFSVFLIYGVFARGQLGSWGNGIINFFFGLLGVVAYIFPFFLLIFGIQCITKGNKKRKKFFRFSIMFMLCLSFLSFLVNVEKFDLIELNFIELFVNLFKEGAMEAGPTGGGALSIFVAPFIKFFGLVGTYIIFICAAIVSFFILTEIHPAEILLWIKDRIQEMKIPDDDEEIVEDDKERIEKTEKKKLDRKLNIEGLPEEIPIEKFDLANQIEIDEVKDGKVEKGVPLKSEQKNENIENIDKVENKTEQKVDNGPIPTINVDTTEPEVQNYILPPIDILQKPKSGGGDKYKKELITNANKLESTLESFGVSAKVINVSRGPAVTRYEIAPDTGVKVSKIVGLTDDIALNLAAPSIRMEAPIPGKAAVGIEIPNTSVDAVFLREVIDTAEFKGHPSKVAFGLGKDTSGKTMIADIAKMPHVLIAGATGSGKSVCINTIITSLLYRAKPNEVKLIMIDPKVVELGVYNGIPHLLIPVVTDPKKAAGALNWAVQEMVKRYNLFAQKGVRDMKGYNEAVKAAGEDGTMPHIVIIVDELADLMMVAPNDVEDAICRLAQMARAAGMHLVIATQRPSVDVITGLIKANVPSRIAFAVSSQVDSRTILDMAGAEKLLGKGDMLFFPMGASKPIRVQGAFVTDKEVEQIVEFIKSKNEVKYDEDVLEKIQNGSPNVKEDSDPGDNDPLLNDVITMIVEIGQASTSLIQRRFKVGYARAARIIDQMEERGIISGFDGTKPRQVLISKENWEEMQAMGNK